MEDAEIVKEDLRHFKMKGVEEKTISVQEAHAWHLSAGRRKKIDDGYKGFSLEQWYQIMILDRKKILGPSPMFEPWMIPDY